MTKANARSRLKYAIMKGNRCLMGIRLIRPSRLLGLSRGNTETKVVIRVNRMREIETPEGFSDTMARTINTPTIPNSQTEYRNTYAKKTRLGATFLPESLSAK